MARQVPGTEPGVPGRPMIGMVTAVRLPAALRDEVDLLAAERNLSRAEWCREALCSVVAASHAARSGLASVPRAATAPFGTEDWAEAGRGVPGVILLPGPRAEHELELVPAAWSYGAEFDGMWELREREQSGAVTTRQSRDVAVLMRAALAALGGTRAEGAA